MIKTYFTSSWYLYEYETHRPAPEDVEVIDKTMFIYLIQQLTPEKLNKLKRNLFKYRSLQTLLNPMIEQRLKRV